MTEGEDFEIVRLGAQGDGVAETQGGLRFVPFALPGERVRVTGDGSPDLISPPSPDRKAPVCRHFGVCGGCVAQHMQPALYADWKRSIVVAAFRQQGLEADVAPLVPVALGSRRRAVLTARRKGGDIALGYHRRASHQIFAMQECPVLAPGIVRQFPHIRALAAALQGSEVRISVLETQAGLDIALESIGRTAAPASPHFAQAALRYGFVRVTHDGELVVQRANPSLDFSGVGVVPPAGSFVQAVSAAEMRMVEKVLEAAAKAKRAADLFAGLGAFTFALARTARVLAVDSDSRAISALTHAARHAEGLKPIETRVRDLFRDPLSPRELEPFDAVVFDPPRAGAKAQALALAGSRVPTIVAVSCNPATLARDARVLVDGGYRIARVVPIDQFLYSAHVEVVAAFAR